MISSKITDFIATIENKTRRADAETLVTLMAEATGEPPALWGTMVGFGSYDYTYDSGHSGTSFLSGFAPRKANTVVYIMPGTKAYPDYLAKLGKHKTAVSCLYINKLADVDLRVLKDLIAKAHVDMTNKHHSGPTRA